MIINPMWIYLLQVVDGIKIFLFILSIILFFALVFSIINLAVELDFDEERAKFFKKTSFVIGITFLIVSILNIVIPSKETLIGMMIARNVTIESIKSGKDAVKDSIDYIFEKIKEIK